MATAPMTVSVVTITSEALEELIEKAVTNAFEQFNSGDAPAPAKKTRTKAKAEPEPEDDDEPVDDSKSGKFDRATLNKKTIAALKKIAIQEGFDPDDLDGASKSDIVDALCEDENEESDDDEDEDAEEAEDDADDSDDDADSDDEDGDEEDDEDGDDEEDEAESFDRTELEGMNLRSLKKLAKENGWTDDELDGIDKAELVDGLMGDEGDAEEEDEEEGDEEAITEEDLEAMSPAQLKKFAAENDIKLRANMRKPQIIEAIMEAV